MVTRAVRIWLAVLLVLTVSASISTTADDRTAADPPAGQLLIASASMQDTRFVHSVILLIRHDSKGAFGIVINHPLGERSIAELLAGAADKNAKDTELADNIRVFLGGPVELHRGFIVHSGEYHRAETQAVVDGVAMTATTDVLRDIGRHQGPAKYLFALGYAGWGAGQLEDEITQRAWFTAPAQPDLVFDAERETVWEKALARRAREL